MTFKSTKYEINTVKEANKRRKTKASTNVNLYYQITKKSNDKNSSKNTIFQKK